MKFKVILLAVALFPPAFAFAQDKQQYISDEITVTVRDGPRNDATYLGMLKSGDRVTVLESLGEASFARVKTSTGKEGWITARFLTDRPAAREALNAVQRDLKTAQARIAELEGSLNTAQGNLAQARPALELAKENDQLRAQISELQRAMQETELRFNEQKASRKTMATGGVLVAAGIFLGLLLPWIGSSRKRRHRGDF
ncbi:MAG: TIGR04211 family SH3 domain-containing protein [Pseudomonadota bacterium]|nr:TIGR04211 family SH3 domain-containing protein [Pseudomonadota bacterium]